MLARIVCWLLSRKNLSVEERSILIQNLIKSIGILPTSDIIEFDKVGNIYVNKQKLEIEQAMALRDSASTLYNSYARKLIKEQLKFLAIKTGVYEGVNTEQILFSKAMLYLIQEEENIITKLSLDNGIIN